MDTQQGHVDLKLACGEAPIARYTSGLTIYEETLVCGRWVGRYWTGTGFVEPEWLLRWVEKNARTPEDTMGLDLGAFGIEIDGQSLHFGWEMVRLWEAEASHPGSRHAVVGLRSTLRPITVQVHTETDGTGLLTRWLTITNNGSQPAALGAAWVWSGILTRVLNWQPLLGSDGPVFSVGYMTDRRWGDEGAFDWQPLPSTPLRIESRMGKSGHGTPFFVVRNEATGEHIVGGLAWSGNWAVELTCEQLAGADAWLAFRSGPVSPGPQRVIAAGETVTTPQMHLGVLQTDFDGAIQAWHRHLRQSVLMPEVPGREGLVILNHWGYCLEEVTEEQLKLQVDIATEIGAELLVVDAGWFGNRCVDYWQTIGDWECGYRLPNGLEPIFAYARQKGLLYGLWLDLERMGSECKAAKEHPEWLLQCYGQPTPMGDMDLTNPAAVAYIEDAVCRVIERYDLDLFRLDYNLKPFEAGQTPRDGYMENTLWRYYENVYALYERLHARFPRLIMETCAGGGGRTDLGLVSRFHHTWITDWQEPPRSLKIVNGMSMALPPERVDRNSGVGQGGHIRADLDSPIRSCMFGHFTLTGIYPERGEGNPGHIARIRHHVDLYKQFIRPFLATCRTYHHTPVLPGKEPHGWAVLEYVSEDDTRAVVGIFRLAGPAEEIYHLRLRGVDAGRRYQVTFDNSGQVAVVTGAALRNEGLTVRLGRPLTSELLTLQAVD